MILGIFPTNGRFVVTNGTYKPRVLSGQPGSYYAALGKHGKRSEEAKDTSEYWAERVKAKGKK